MDKIKKRLSACLAALFIAASIPAQVIAAPTAAPTSAPEATEAAATEAPTQPADIYMENSALDAPNTDHAGAALLMEMKTGRLLYGKNIDEQLYPASTTKMMTAILALESGKMNETAVATYEALQSITLEDSHMGILLDEQLSMTDLLNGMLIYSANDAANVIAVHVGGSMDEFVGMMNRKAQELGMTGTHFVNPCGVHDPAATLRRSQCIARKTIPSAALYASRLII